MRAGVDILSYPQMFLYFRAIRGFLCMSLYLEAVVARARMPEVPGCAGFRWGIAYTL